MYKKLILLKQKLIKMKSVAVAYSGGIDSTLLLKVAHNTIGDQVVGITTISASVPKDELAEAKEIAEIIGAQHVIIHGREIDDPRYLENTSNRCFFCRHITYEDIINYAQNNGFNYVVDGTNADDLNDHRPGSEGSDKHG